MKPVFQEIIDAGKGDCFSACLASLFELPIDRVPKFRRDHGRDMTEAARAWVLEHFGLALISIQMENRESDDFSGSDMRFIGGIAKTPCIAAGVSPNVPGVDHAVVGEVDGIGNFTLLHDPNPSGKGIDGAPKFIYLFVPMDLAEYGYHSKLRPCGYCDDTGWVEDVGWEPRWMGDKREEGNGIIRCGGCQ